MIEKLRLSELVTQIQETLEMRFDGEMFWITTQITDVRRQESLQRCYLKFIEKQNGVVTAEIRGVFWSNGYEHIPKFEKATGESFKDGIEITCLVKVKFHARFGLSLEVQAIDYAYTLGTLELERQQTLERLVKENPSSIRLHDGLYLTENNTRPLPLVVQRIALITAPNSDGQRDFKQELEKNKHGYAYSIHEFLTSIQGDEAHRMILQQLLRVHDQVSRFDALAIVRGGGSQTDFKPFDDYDLARTVALFPIPVITGIGHDRNTSITDLMARQMKTPTKAATFLVDHNFDFEERLLDLQARLQTSTAETLRTAKSTLAEMKRLVKLASPTGILKKGFAIIMQDEQIITDPRKIKLKDTIQTRFLLETLESTVTKKTKNEKEAEL